MNVQPPKAPKTLEELESALLKSVESLDAGKGVDGKKALARLRKRIKTQRRCG